jgi:hypothetical protein
MTQSLHYSQAQLTIRVTAEDLTAIDTVRQMYLRDNGQLVDASAAIHVAVAAYLQRLTAPVVIPPRPRFWTRPWFALVALIAGFAAGLALALWI